MISFGYGADLIPLDSDCKDTIRRWRNDPAIYKWCRQKTVISDLEHEQWFDTQSKDHKIQMFGINHGASLVGVCGFTDIDNFNRRAEFSLYIAPSFHGRGYGETALKTLIAHGFMDLGFNCIWGETFDGNRAAATFEKVGMKKEGTRREFYFKNGRMIDCHLYSILRSEWHL